MRYTLLQVVQKCLEVVNGEEVNSISDSKEAQDIASICEDVYHAFCAEKKIPEHQELTQLEALSDTDFPTHFKFGSRISELKKVFYDQSEVSGQTDWREVIYVSPLDFLLRTDNIVESKVLVSDKKGGTSLSIRNDQYPTFYTSFDNEHIVMNAYKATVDSTLQQSKSRAYSTKFPPFTIEDSFIPDLDDMLSVLFLAECKVNVSNTLEKEVPPKLEQEVRRLRGFSQGARDKVRKGYKPHGFGRKV